MRFSFRIFLALMLFFGLWALVVRQVLIGVQNSPQTTILQEFFQAINPFWKAKNPDNFNDFPVKIPISIENPSQWELTVSGKIFLFDEKNIWLENISTDPENPEILTNYLELNPEKITISPQNTHIFTALWKWFGDKFLIGENVKQWENSQNPDNPLPSPTIVFRTPAEIAQSSKSFEWSFYEKTFLKKHEYALRVQAEIVTKNSENPEKTEEFTKNFSLKIPFFTLEKTLNTGLFVNFGMIIVMILCLWELISPRTHIAKTPRISREELEKLEAELQKIANQTKNKSQ